MDLRFDGWAVTLTRHLVLWSVSKSGLTLKRVACRLTNRWAIYAEPGEQKVQGIINKMNNYGLLQLVRGTMSIGK